MKIMRSGGVIALAVLLMLSLSIAVVGQGVTGAIFTTDSECSGVDLNIYAAKEAVYLDGGPVRDGASGLPDGDYYVQVTDPSGHTVLGTSVVDLDPIDEVIDAPPIHVTGGEFAQCYQLWSIVYNDGGQGYADTPNAGGEYKVWVSQDPTFQSSETKTDNFKVKPDHCEEPATLVVVKFYDANANGQNDDGQEITGWKVSVLPDGSSEPYIRYTRVEMQLDPGKYLVSEFMPLEDSWHATTPTSVEVSLVAGETETVYFGNLCLGAGGGKTKGFWTNKNGAKKVGDDDLELLACLNLVDAEGDPFDPTAYGQLKAWLQDADAVNMAYMLSAQLAAMELNVYNGFVDGGALIYAPDTTSANTLGYATVAAVMAEANEELGEHPITLSDSEFRAYQEALKDALDNANNNQTFVQATPCDFTFAE